MKPKTHTCQNGGISMERLKVTIMIDKDHKLGRSEYVKGKISGMVDCICDTFTDRRVPLQDNGIGTFVRTYATIEEYVRLKTKIEAKYSGLCKIGIDRIDIV